MNFKQKESLNSVNITGIIFYVFFYLEFSHYFPKNSVVQKRNKRTDGQNVSLKFFSR